MTNESTASKIQELFDLFQSGAITKEEFELLKGDILHERVSEGNISQRLQENPKSRVERNPARKKRGINKWIWAVLAVVVILAGVVFIFKMSDSGSGVFTNLINRVVNKGSGTFTDPRDGQRYRWVKIGDQVWMAENLAFRPSSGNYWAYDNDQSNVSKYGYLYNWETACQVCPPGWHLPSDKEWSQLIDYVVSQGYPKEDISKGAVNALKSCRQVGSPLGGECNTSDHPRWNFNDTHYGFDEFGFSALPGGYRSINGIFYRLGFYGYWWSSTEHSSTNAWYRGMYYDDGYVASSTSDKASGFSLRCVRD